MELIEKIRKHPLYQEYYDKLAELERNRVFCRHQMEHFLDVARIAYIHNLESGLGIRKEVIYAAALLHDIGRARQYTEGILHERASAEIAARILEDVSAGTGRPVSCGSVLWKAGSGGSVSREEFSREEFSGEEFSGETFSEEERREILHAILGHRKKGEGMTALEELLYISDKQSRPCFVCPAEKECNWSEGKKNREVEI